VRLESLQVRNFRNYEELGLSFEKRLTFLTGQNAAGKTNLLEAIAMLSLGKSFRGSEDFDLIKDGTTGYSVSGKFLRGGGRNQIEINVDASSGVLKRRIRLNEKVVSGRGGIIGQLLCVIFSPADLTIVEGAPAERRRFIDSTLSSMDSGYLDNLVYYQKALKQRNTLLKRIRERKAAMADLTVWESRLCEYAARLWEARGRFIEDFSVSFAGSLEQISGARDAIEIRVSNPHMNDLAGSIARHRERDVRVGFTSCGPHRDMIQLQRRGKDIMQFGSQGQKRTAALALRIGQFDYLKRTTGYTPVLLIDDVIRELDASRRSAFVALLEKSGQAIFTTPDLDGIEGPFQDLLKTSTILRVENGGKVREQDGSPG
jgi:DNA replication and repair protein RecF